MKNNKKKLIKNLLATTSLCAMIITGGASSALGAAGDERVTDGNYLLETGDNIKDVGGGGPTPSPFLNQEKLKFGGDHSGSTGTFADTIDYIETNGKNPGAFTINGTAITITSVTGGGNGLPIVMENGSQLTLSGVNYDALASIEAANLGNGILHLTGNGLVYNGTIGKTLRLAEINVNAGGKAVTLGGAVKATTININAKDTLTLNGATNADVINFTDEGTITLNENLGGASGADAAVKFAADGTLAVTGNRTITGTIDNTSGADGVGTLTFNNQGRVTGLIGNTNALELVKLDGANTKDVTFDSLVKAQELQLTGGGDAILSKGATIDKLTISNADSYVQIGNTQTLEFTGNTTPIDLTGNNGHIRFGDANSVLKFNTVAAADVTINLDGDLDPGAVGKGIIKFDASNANIIVNNVNGAATQSLGIAGGNILKEIEISSGANKSVTLNTIINTDKLKINASANVKYDPKGDVDLRKITFGDANSSLTLIASGAADCKFTLQEDVNPGGADQGIVMLDGSAKKLTLDANAAGKTLGHTNKLNKVVAKGDVKITNLVTVNATNFNVLTGTADVKNASVLGSNITIGTAAVPAVLGAAAVAAIPATLAIDSNHQAGPININDNGTTIKFEDANSTLKLTNNTVANGAGADTIFTLKGNLISNSTAAPAAYTNGQLVIEATAAKLKITPDAAEKIGDDADKRFKKVTVSGNQEITLTPQIFTETFEVINKANVIVSNASVLNSNITIGTPAVPAGAAAIPATLAIDSNQVAAIDIRSTPAGNGAAARTITFEHEDSILKLTNNNANGVGVATIFTLKENLISDATATVVAAGKYTHGHLVIEATAEKLTIEPAVVGGVAKTIGDDADKRFKKVTVSGNKEITLTPQIFTETFEVINGANVIVSNASVLDSNITIGATNGVAVGAATLAIDSNRQAGPIDIMPTPAGNGAAARTIQFEHEDSILKLTNNNNANGGGVATIFTLNENLITKDYGLAAANYTRGHLVIEATAKQLTIEPAVVVGVAKTIGESADKRFKKVTISGNGEEESLANKIILLPTIFTETFEVIYGAIVEVPDASVLNSNITIGTPAVPAVPGGAAAVAAIPATLAIDSNLAPAIDIRPTPAVAPAARTITFEHEDSTLKLTNNNAGGGGGGAPTTFKLKQNLISDATATVVVAGKYTHGKLVIEAKEAKLTITPNGVGAAETIGESVDKRFKKVTISGNKDITITPKIFSKEIEISSTGAIELGAIELGDVSVVGDSKLKFTTDSNNAVKFTDHVTVHTIDFNDKVRNITVDNNKKITTQKIVKGDKAKITFAGNGELKLSNGADTAVFEQIIAGAAGSEVKLSAGSYTGEIQFSDTGKITAANQFVLNGGFNTTGGAAGVIEFEGTSTITGDLGSASRLGAVTVKGGGELIVCGNVNVATLDGVAGTEKLTFNNRAKIEVNGDIGGLQQFALITLGGGEVDFKGAVNTVAFSFATDSTIGSDLGATNIVAGGGNRILTVTADQNITGDIGDFGTLHVDGDKTITLNTAKFEAAITTKTDGQGTINVLRGGNDVKIKSIGTVGEKFKEVNIGAEITAGTAGAGVYTQALNINANAEALLTDVNADNITVNDDGQVVFLGDLISANPIKFTHADSAAGFFDMDINNALISDGGARRGNIGIYGSKLKANIGTNAAPVKAVEFNDNYNGVATAKKSEIDANIYAEDIVVRRDYKLKLQKDVEFGGKTTIDQAIITLGEHDLTLKGGASSITTSTIKTTVNRGNVGNFVAGAGANVTLNGEITVDVNVTAMPADKARVFLIKKDPTGTINKAGANFKIVKSAGAFADWTVENNDEGLALVFQDNTAEVISSDLASIGASSPTSSENSQAIEDAIDGTDGEAIQSLFNSFSDSSERADAIVRLFDNLSDNASEVSTENVSIAIDSVSSRISDNFVVPIAIDSSAFNFVPDTTSTIGTPDIGSSTPSSSLPPQIVDSAGNATPTGNVAPTGNTTSTGSATQTGGTNASKPAATTPQKATTGTKTNTTGPNDGKARAQRKVSSEEIIYGLSAGDDPTRYGVWMAPFAGNGVKKKNKTASGYKSTSVGGTFGFDTKVNDNLVLGLAVTALNSRVNHKDFKKGDKTKIDTTLFSAYASIDMGSNWYSQNIASIGSSRVENKENRRVSRASYGIANGKYSTMHFALESTTGFNKLINNQVVLTPSFGLGYSRVNDTSYTETGNVGAQALTITKKASQKLELIGGLRLTALPFMVNEMYVTPEVHASVRHDVIGKNPTTFSKVNGLRDLKEKSKPTKTYYGVGGGLKFSYNMMDYGVYADTTYAKKYVGVNGSVNVRVNF